MKKIFGIFLILIGLASIGWVGGSHLWKLENNILKPIMSKWKVDFGTAGMNSDTLTITSGDTASAYMKVDTLKFIPKKGSGYFDLRLWTLLLKDGDYYFGSILPADSISRIGKSDSAFAYGYYKYLHSDSLRVSNNSFLGDTADSVVLGKGGIMIIPSADLTDTSIITGEKVNSHFFFQELYNGDKFATAASGNNTNFYGGFVTLSPDSFTVDSIRVVYYVDQADVYIDSIAIFRGITRDGSDGTQLFGDGTDIGSGATGFFEQTYITNFKISYDWKLNIIYFVETVSTAGNGRVYSAKAYCHYQ